MTTDENDENTRTRSPDRVEFQAQARAMAAVAEAMARADSAVARADARAKERIAAHLRRMQELNNQPRRTARVLSEPEAADPTTAEADELYGDPAHPAPPREAIELRAYYKAAQRRFSPGHEVEDWLQAERELLTGSPASG